MKKLNLIQLFGGLLFGIVALTGCGSSDTANLNTSTPTLQSLVANIDENNSGIADINLGTIEVLSEGSSPINSYQLQGIGASNFDIDAQGKITTKGTTELNCTSFTQYNLTAQAQTNHGNSNTVDVLIQTNCLDVPVIEETKLYINAFESGIVKTLPLIRTGLIANSVSSDIKSLQIKGDSSTNFTLSSNPPKITINSTFGTGKQRYDYQIRAINTSNKVGPYSTVTIFIR